MMNMLQLRRPALLIGSLLFALVMLFLPVTALAAQGDACDLADRKFGIPTWYKYIDGVEESSGRCVPDIDLQKNGQGVTVSILLAVFDILIFFAGIIAVGYIIYGSVLFILSQGEPDKVKNARGTIINALVGLVIVLVATAAINLIGNVLTTNSQDEDSQTETTQEEPGS